MKNALALCVVMILASAKLAMAASQTAIFAGGCFWCLEADFADVPGVTQVVSGYTGGALKNPTYKQVSSGQTGHVEAIEVTYDPAHVSYDKLLTTFWDNVDPLDDRGQFCDKGSQYRAGIFYLNEDQRRQAEASLTEVQKKHELMIVTKIAPASPFYPAEDEHQGYAKNNEIYYKLYRSGCGRDARLKELKGQF